MEEFVELVFDTPLRRSFTYKNTLSASLAIGARVLAPFGRRAMTGCVVAKTVLDTKPEYEIKQIEKILDEKPLLSEELLSLAQWMANLYLCSLGEAIFLMLPCGKKESSVHDMGIEDFIIPDSEVTLSEEQEYALEQIALGKGLYYLYGITGSGKTEVFLQAASRVRKEGKAVIYLVPEIALTHQVIEQVQKRFGSDCAVIHSGLTPKAKLESLSAIARGEKNIVVGARSAVFAPVKNLGLIIIDEEHESSYKSGSTPRYHARQIAMKRCAQAACALVMGSATPSVEAWQLMQSKRIIRLELTKRLSGGAVPRIEAVSLLGEKAFVSGSALISRKLYAEMQETLAMKRQVILFLNRRGFSYYFHCRSCGWSLSCRQCSVTLTYHKGQKRAVCHYCGYSSQAPNVCPDCGSLDVGYSGFGTEMVEEDVQKLFPEANIARVDTDSVQKKGSLEAILKDFKEGKYDILLGTQMVAKGLNFPLVRLVGVILADTSLHLPDFRSSERTFGLITQVAGRAGRFVPDGRVLVQTYKAKVDAVAKAIDGDIAGFYENELFMRREAEFPPFTRLIRFVFRSKEKDKSMQCAEAFAAAFLQEAGDRVELLGPSECPLSVISGNYRVQLIARSSDFNTMHAYAAQVYYAFNQNTSVYIEADVDPLSML